MKNPKWFQDQKAKLRYIAIVELHIADPHVVEFHSFINAITKNHNEEIEIPQLKDELDTSDFEKYLSEHCPF